MHLPKRLNSSKYPDNLQEKGIENFSSALPDPSQSQSTPVNPAVLWRPLRDDEPFEIASLFYDYARMEGPFGRDVDKACENLRKKLEESPIIAHCTTPAYGNRTLLAWFAGHANGELLEVVVETIKKEAEKARIQPDVDPKDEAGVTPLLALAHYGASNTNSDVAAIKSLATALDCLLLNGANPNSTNNLGFSGLHFAVQNESHDKRSILIIDRLLRAGANPNSLTAKAETPLDFFLANEYAINLTGNTLVGKLLIIAGAKEVNRRNYTSFGKFLQRQLGLTPLTYEFLRTEIELKYSDLIKESIDDRWYGIIEEKLGLLANSAIEELKKQLLQVFERMLTEENDELDDRPSGKKIIKKILTAATPIERETIVTYLQGIRNLDPRILEWLIEEIPDNTVELLEEFIEAYEEAYEKFPDMRYDLILREYWRSSMEAFQEKMPQYILEKAKKHPTILRFDGVRLSLSREDYKRDHDFFVQILNREKSLQQQPNTETVRFFKSKESGAGSDIAPTLGHSPK